MARRILLLRKLPKSKTISYILSTYKPKVEEDYSCFDKRLLSEMINAKANQTNSNPEANTFY